MTHQHTFGLWAASFLYWGLLGSERTCRPCGRVERATLGGYRDERRNRVAGYLTTRLAR